MHFLQFHLQLIDIMVISNEELRITWHTWTLHSRRHQFSQKAMNVEKMCHEFFQFFKR
jgi:hypothetical protein